MPRSTIDDRHLPRRAFSAPTPAVVALVAGVMVGISLDALGEWFPSSLPAYTDWALDYPSPSWLLWWVLGDTTEATLYKSAPGGLLMIAGAAFAHYGSPRRRGFPLACATDLWPWVAISAGLALLASNLAWGWTLTSSGLWQPTFAPFVSVPPAVVVMYGRGWAVAATGAALGVLLVTPLSLLMVNEVSTPLDLSPIAGSVTGMCLGGALAFTLCRHLPWLASPAAGPRVPPPETSAAGTEETDTVRPRAQQSTWVVRRVLADFTEAHFYGNEWAGAGLLLGTIAAFAVNPAAVSYGSGLFPELLAAQLLAGACGVVLWRRRWARYGMYPTFVPIVSVTPATVLTYGGSPASILAGAALGAAIAPPLADAAARRLPAHIQPMVAYTATMAVCTVSIVPILGLLPGFRTV
ncbi:hypothetical protein ACIBSV_42335 [Embleya sp. NPDC050154]|uniref:hypothetical protein n=1 Tax=Embleya sp. NPDC050154 TaxID=3363988 RepID=UPI0037BA9EA3